MSHVTPMDVIFNVGGDAIGGDMDTVMQTGFGSDMPYVPFIDFLHTSNV